MKHYFVIIIFLLITVSSLPTYAESKFSVFSHVENLPETGQFEQQRQLKIIQKPFVSSGHFKINADHFSWHTTKPFDVSYRISNEVIEETIDGVTKVQKLDDNPQMAAFAQVFSSLVKLDKAVLEDNFVLQATHEGENWSLLLKPKKEPINKVFSSIVIEGDKSIRTIRTHTLSGDSNLISLKYED